MKKTVKRLTESEYTQIKTLIGLGLKNSMVGEITKRSSATVSNIKASTSYQNYQNFLPFLASVGM